MPTDRQDAPVATPTRLKRLLRDRHWQVYRTFQAEYDRAAKPIDPHLVGTWPSRAQLHRWMSGEVRSLPYPEHCRVLEAMFPGYTVAQLFEPDDPDAPEGGTITQPAPGAGPAWHGATVATTDPSPDPGEQPEPPTPQRTGAGGGVNYRAGEAGLDDRVAASHAEWLATRRRLNRHRTALTRAAARLYPDEIRLADTGILQPPAWRLERPVELTSIGLDWREVPPPAVTGHHRETRPLRPLCEPGQRYPKYSRAMRDLDRPRLFENRVAYRLAGVDHAPDGSGTLERLTLGNMCYFDMIDVGEALAHETALAATTPDGDIDPTQLSWDALPLRRMVRDPFHLPAYPLMLSISTLTVRRSPAGTTFLLLRRSPAKVAIAGGMLSVMPTGVFQPASVVPAPNSPDFDLWRNMMREYSEEFLGNPEHDGDGPPIDYTNTEPFRTMDAARQAGKIRVYCLGLGVDALNYVGDVLTVAIFDADVFDQLFDGMVEHNDEGSVVTTDRERREFTFDADTITRLLTTEPVAPSGAACLRLAWQHHEAVLS